MRVAREIRSPAHSSAVGLAFAIAAQLAAQTPERAVAALSSAVPAERLRALKELDQLGPTALPALIAELEKVTKGEPRETVMRLIHFGSGPDSERVSYERRVAGTEFACDDWSSGFEFGSAAKAKAERADLARILSWHDDGAGVVFRLLHAIRGNGEHAAAAVPLLVDLLAHDYHAVGAATTLVAIGDPAVPALLAALGDPRRGSAAAATLAAVRRDRDSAALRESLRKALTNGTRAVREPALTALGLLGEGATVAEAAAVAELLPMANERLVQVASWALGRMGDVGAAEIQKLLAGDLDARRRSTLLSAVPLLGDRARHLAATVFAAAEGAATTPVCRAFAAAMPGSPMEERAVDWLLAAATRGGIAERVAALRALASFPSASRRTVTIAVAACTGEEFLGRIVACSVLARLRLRDEAAAAATLAIVQREGLHIGAESAALLAQLGAISADDVRSQDKWKELDVDLRREALHAFAVVHGDPAARLLEWLGDERLFYEAAIELGGLGTPVVARLTVLLDDASCGRGASEALARAGEAGIAAVLAHIADQDAAVAHNATEALRRRPEAIGALVLLLRSGAEAQRDAAAALLARIELGTQRQHHVDALLAAAAEAPATRRADLLTAVESVTTDAVCAFLVRAVGDDRGEVRRRAVTALGIYHDVARPEVQAAMLRALRDEMSSVRMAAASALGAAFGSDPAIAEALRSVAVAVVAEERAAGLATLGMFRAEAATALPLLAAALADGDESVRIGALVGMRSLGPLATGEQSRVLALVRSDKAKAVRIAAIDALSSMRPEFAAAWDRLRERARLGESSIGRYGGRSGGRIVLPGRLRAELRSGDVPRILEALQRARSLGERGSELLPDLEELLAHAEIDVRAATVEAIGAVGGDDAPPLLLRGLGDAAPTVRVAAIGRLRLLDKKFAAVVFGPIASCVGDADDKVRAAAATALGVMARRDGSLQPDVELQLQVLLADPVPAVRIAAGEAATELKGLHRGTVVVLARLLEDEQSAVRLAGVRGLRAAGVAASHHAPRVLELGRAGDVEVAGAAIRTLVEIAPDREDGWWFAVERLNDKDFAVSWDGQSAYRLLGL